MTLSTHTPRRGGGPGPRSITHCNTYLLGLKLFSLISRPLAVSSLFELYVCITPVGDSSNRTKFLLQKTALHTLKTTSVCPMCPCLNSSPLGYSPRSMCPHRLVALLEMRPSKGLYKVCFNNRHGALAWS